MHDWAAFETVGNALLSQRWIYAKSMPKYPHEYALRSHWAGRVPFDFTVTLIRDKGYQAWFQGRSYTRLNVNDRYYWTMGAPLEDTILINRAIRQAPVEYDRIAPYYDGLFQDNSSLLENQEIMELLSPLNGGNILDVGCGTGLVLDYLQPDCYTGIDPSQAMLDRLTQKHPERSGEVLRASLASFVGDRYALVVALFGAASYLSPEELERIPLLLSPGGHYLLMFYRDGYVPVTYRKTGISVPHFPYRGTPAGSVREWHNFVIVEGRL